MKRGCSMDGCEKPVFSNGWCNSHNSKWWRQHRRDKLCLIDGCMEIHDFRRPKSSCLHDGCERRVVGHGLCSTHYAQSRRVPRPEAPPCAVREKGRKGRKCGKVAIARGLCSTHYRRLRKHGDVTVKLRQWGDADDPLLCKVRGCKRVHHALGWCKMHHRRWERHGNPLTIVSQDQGKDSRHPHHSRWYMMMQRCYNPDAMNFHHYGGRGISVHPKWHNFLKFRDYLENVLGARPEGWSLDRIDCDGNYEPGNVRWASAKMQANNRRNNVNVGGVWTDPDEHHQCSICKAVFKSLSAFDRHMPEHRKTG